MKPLQLYIFSLFLALAGSSVFAQDAPVTGKVDPGVSLYVDYGKLLTLASPFETKVEGGISVRLKSRIAPNVQFGMGKLEPSRAIENGTYTSEGYYGRVGVNYLVPFDATNTLYAGAKYGMSRYEESGTYEIESNLWPTRKEGFSRTNLQADWFEIILGSEKRLKNSNWSLGGYFSLRILNSHQKFEPIDTYAIPGYGRAFDKTIPAANVYVRFAF